MKFSKSQMAMFRLKAADSIRSLKINDPENIEFHKLAWSDLNSMKAESLRQAGKFRDDLDKQGNEDEKRSNEIETCFNILLAISDECAYELDQRSALGNRSPRLRAGDRRRPVGEDLSIRGDGEEIGRRAQPAESVWIRPDQRMADYLPYAMQMCDRHQDVELGHVIRAAVIGPRNDAERRALAGGTNSAGGYTVPDILSVDIVDMARSQSVVMTAGAMTVPLFSDKTVIAKVASDPTPAWRGENEEIVESDPTFGAVTFTPRSLGCLVKVPVELLEDSVNIGTVLPEVIAAAMALELDRVALLGSGTAPEPKGVKNFSGIQTIAHNASLAGYAPLNSARTLIKTQNHKDVTGYIMHPRDEGILAGLVDTTGQPIVPPPALADKPFHTTTNIPVNGGVGTDESTIFAGDFSKLMIGMRTGVIIMPLRERYAEFGQVAFLAFMRADIQAMYENAFVKITGVKP